MPEYLPGAVFSGISTAVFVIVLRTRAGMSRLPVWKLALIGLGAALVIPWVLKVLAAAWRATPGLPDLPVVTFDQVFIGVLMAIFVLAVSNRPGGQPRVPLWAGLLSGVLVAALLPPLLYIATGVYQRPSLHPHLNQCARWEAGENGARTATNICNEPIAVGLCLPGELNPAPCAQMAILAPGETATFDPRGTAVSSLPSNLDGHTTAACRPPTRPSRMGRTTGRGNEGVCLPPE